MAIGILNPGDATNSTTTRPSGVLSAVNQRRWFSGDLNTELKDQDLNAILGQLRHVIDYYGITDVEGDDTLLRQAIAAGATSLTGNVAALQGLAGVTDSVPYFTSPATMSSFVASGYSRGLLAKTSIVQWQAELGIGAGSSPNVIALGGLAGGADMLPYFTGLGVMGQTLFTAAARTLLDDADVATMRTTLGLSTGATANISLYMLIAGGAHTGYVTVHADPVAALGVATKQMVDLKAPLNAPTFTGIPAAPTAAPATNTTQLATTAFVTAAVGAAGFAGLASPAFTGVPTAPTAALGINTTQIATTAYVVQGFAPLASPALTGTPTAPTPAGGDNSTKIATTAFVAGVAFAGFAPIASPTFTGVPAAPTAAPGTNTTQLATTAYVASYAPLASPTFTGVPAAPTAAPGVSTTQLATTAFVTTADALKANVSNPAFTGAPTAPTASIGTNTTQLATTAYVVQGFAPLISPTFTGVPAVPTATGGTNTTQIASTAFVTAAVAAGVVPYAPLASPALTGTPTAPTAAPGTNTTQIASTAFVTASNTGANTLAALLTVDGVGSLLDADLLDGQQGTWYQDLANATGTLANARLTGAYTGITNLSMTGTLTGTVNQAGAYEITWVNNGGPVGLSLNSGGATNKTVSVSFSKGGLPRWILSKNAIAESGGASRVGSDLALDWYADDLSATGTALVVRRSTGVFEFAASPTAPTPTVGDSSTKLATTAFVATATAGITGFAPLASPAFTGIPTAPTAAPGTNTTQIATTAYVQGFVGGGGYAPINNPVFTGVVTAPQFIAPTGLITTNQPGLDVTQTWNTAGVAFMGVRVNITATNWGTGAYLFDVQIGGVHKFGVDPYGVVRGTEGFVFGSSSSQIALDQASGVFYGYGSAVAGIKWMLQHVNAANGVAIAASSELGIGFNSTTDMQGGTRDTILYRDAANTLALRRLANPQVFRIYNTTDATNTNYERLSISYAANIAKITHEAGGTGTAGRTVQLFAGANGVLQFGANAGLQWQIPATGHLLPLTNNAFDVGSNTMYARNLYTGVLNVPGTYLTSRIKMGTVADAIISYNDGWLAFASVGFGMAFTLYGSGFDTANYEGLFLSAYSGPGYPFAIRTTADGTGVWRSLRIQTWDFGPIDPLGGPNVAGHLTHADDNLCDIGAVASGRPRTLYVGTNINVASGTLTANKPALDLSQTWNNAAGDFTAIKMNITKTAILVTGSSFLTDYQVDGDTKFCIDVLGSIYCPGFAFMKWESDYTSVIYDTSDGYMYAYNAAGLGRWQLYSNGAANTAAIHVASDMGYGWNSTNTLDTGTRDVNLFRDAASILALRTLTAPQTFRVYATTDATNTNFSRAALSADATRVSLAAQKGGSGTDRALRIINETAGILELGTNNAVRWQIDASGHLMAATDNVSDIGAAAATRPRSIFVGTNVQAGNSMSAGAGISTSTRMLLAAGTATISSQRILSGVAPTTPVDGDIWFTGTALQMRVGGVTKTVTMT